VTSAFAGWLLPVGVAALAAAALLVGPLGLGRGARLRSSRADWRTFWSFAGLRGLSAAIDAGSMWVGVVLTAALAGNVQAGLFGAVGRYVLAGLLIMQGLRVAVAPRLSYLLGQDRRAAAVAVYRRTTTAIVALSWPGFVVLAVFAPGFLQLFGGEFTAGAPAMAVLCCAMLVNSGVGIVQTMLLMGGRSGRHLLVTASGLLLNVAGCLILVPRHGALGAAVAWSIGIVTENVLAAFAARAVVGESLRDRSIVRTALAAGGGTLLLAGVVAALAGRGIAGMTVTIGLVAFVVAASLGHPAVRARAHALISTQRSTP
jgi:O-antigen/teichoic acid export membrane protein